MKSTAGVELRGRGDELAEQRPRVLEHLLGRREAGLGGVDQRLQLLEQVLRSGETSRQVLERRRELARRRAAAA